MAARVPLDVDLEDRLVYGLTPIRLAYMAVALVAGFAIWSAHWGPGLVRGLLATGVILLGAIASWGRWRGRAADQWTGDILVFALHNYRFEWNEGWRPWPLKRPGPTNVQSLAGNEGAEEPLAGAA